MMLGINEIKKRIPHRFPMLLIDKIIELEEGKRGIGVKCVTINESFFNGHFPQEPIMPGVLIVESMAQLAAIILSGGGGGGQENEEKVKQPKYLVLIDNIKFRKPVIPGDRMIIEVNLERRVGNLVKVRVEATVDDEVVAKGELTVAG